MESATSSSTMTIDPRKQVVEALRGQTLIVPDLFALYSNWKVDLHPDYEQVRAELEQWLLRWVPNEENRKKQRKVDSAMLSGFFWTGVPLDKYRTLAEFMSWYFLWDDGKADASTISSKKQYRKDTLAFLKYCLEPGSTNGRPPVSDGTTRDTSSPSDRNFSLITLVVHALRRYANDVYNYVEAVSSHQEQREIGLSTIEGYIERRLHTIGAYPCLTIMEWAYGLNIPSLIYEHKATKVIMRETALASFLSNDIISLKKEVAAGEVDSMVPIIMHHRHVSAQEAMEQVVELLEKSYNDCTAAEHRLLDLDLDGKVRDNVKMLIQGCKNVILGGVYWAYATDRYLPRSCSQGNKILIEL
ncbi:hypothetical protein VTN77DRAFT_7305 [Rasamsonia byssochlamydoides]|uniref:uncharacterized protein n=1 Tax=Rasamsonia byssochlamydoides TaxID=89139 RepID=UPI0037437A3F